MMMEVSNYVRVDTNVDFHGFVLNGKIQDLSYLKLELVVKVNL